MCFGEFRRKITQSRMLKWTSDQNLPKQETMWAPWCTPTHSHFRTTETMCCLLWKHRGHFVQLPGIWAQWYFLKQNYSPGTSLHIRAGIHLGHCSYSCKTVSTITFCFPVLIAFQSKRNLDWFFAMMSAFWPEFFLGKTTKLDNLVSQRKKKSMMEQGKYSSCFFSQYIIETMQ